MKRKVISIIISLFLILNVTACANKNMSIDTSQQERSPRSSTDTINENENSNEESKITTTTNESTTSSKIDQSSREVEVSTDDEIESNSKSTKTKAPKDSDDISKSSTTRDTSETTKVEESTKEDEVTETTTEASTTVESSETTTETSKNIIDKNSNQYNVQNVKDAMTGSLGEKVVFLTYDDGLNPKTPELLDQLKANGVHATFFIVGNSINNHNGWVLKRMLDEGHSIGLHSFDHVYNKLYPNRVGNTNEIVRQFEATLNAIRKYVGSDWVPTVWRYPGGHLSWKGLAEADKIIYEKYGTINIDWNSEIGDATAKPPKNISQQIDRIFNTWWGSKDTMVLLLHDGSDAAKTLTRKSTKNIVDALRAEGFKFGII